MNENSALELQYRGLRSKRSGVPPWWLASVPSEPPKPLEIQPEEAVSEPSGIDFDDIPEFHAQPIVRESSSAFKCPRCWSTEFVDTVLERPPHNGQSTRRDCAACNRTMGFPVWYGEARASESAMQSGPSASFSSSAFPTESDSRLDIDFQN